MAIDAELINKFTALRKKREQLQNEYVRREATIESSRQRYANIMKEMSSLGIGSVDELKERIAALDKTIESEIGIAEKQMSDVEAQISALNDKKVGTPVAG